MAKKKEPPEPWLIHSFQRHAQDNPARTVPGRAFLAGSPPKVLGHFFAVLKAVAEAPPPAFSGGGKWESIQGAMTGYYEVRVDGPKRHHYRLFCLLERDSGDPKLGLGGPSILILTGLDKPFRTVRSAADYEGVRALGNEYRARRSRSVEPPRKN
jgi:hypothetical protein